MTNIRTFLCAALSLTLGACANSPPIHYFSLDDGRPSVARACASPRIAVTQVSLPEIVDRPQLVVREPGHQLQINDQYAWAEPLRRQIPRAVARGLGEELDSFCVVALPLDAHDYDMDYYLALDIQRLEVISGQGVNLDVIWRMTSRKDKTLVGRSMVTEAIARTETQDEYGAVVAAHSRAMRRLAASIAADIRKHLGLRLKP